MTCVVPQLCNLFVSQPLVSFLIPTSFLHFTSMVRWSTPPPTYQVSWKEAHSNHGRIFLVVPHVWRGSEGWGAVVAVQGERLRLRITVSERPPFVSPLLVPAQSLSPMTNINRITERTDSNQCGLVGRAVPCAEAPSASESWSWPPGPSKLLSRKSVSPSLWHHPPPPPPPPRSWAITSKRRLLGMGNILSESKYSIIAIQIRVQVLISPWELAQILKLSEYRTSSENQK